MAEAKAKITIEVKDKATSKVKTQISSMDRLKKSVNKMKNDWLAYTAAIGAVVGVALSSVKAFIKQENAINDLNTVLKSTQNAAGLTSEELQKMARDFQKVSTFSDETTIKAQSLLLTFTKIGKQVFPDAIEAAANMSTALGQDLKQSTLQLGIALNDPIEGVTRLKRVGVSFSDSQREMIRSLVESGRQMEAQKLILNELSIEFGGQARARLQTFSGQVENLKNRFGDLQEMLGKFLLPVFQKLLEYGERIATQIETITQGFRDFGSVMSTIQIVAIEAIKNIVFELVTMIENFPVLRQMMELFNLDLNGLTDKVEAFANRRIAAITRETTKHKQATVKLVKDVTKRELEVKKIEDKKLKEEGERSVQRGVLIEKLTKKEMDMNLQLMKDREKHKEFLKKQKEEEVAAWSDALSRISTLSSAKNKELATIGKAAAIAMSTMDTYAGATKAYSQLGIFGAPAAAAIVAAGLANVSRIAGVQLAEGGVVMPRNGGVQATIAEAGKPEAVIPLDDDEAQNKISEAIGGNTVVIQAGTIVADEMSVRELAQKIDEQLFELKRNNQTVSI